MANSDWDSAADSLTIGAVPGAINAVRNQIKNRADLEHVAFAASGAGGEHKEGSAVAYYEAAAPTLRPDGSTALGSTRDDGRLWVYSDNGVLSYYSGGTWTTVSMAGGVGGSDVVLLLGRSGGQTILGGTGDDDFLKLGGSSHANEGPIEIVAADTTLFEFNEVPVWSLKLGEALDANSMKITGLDDAASAGDALAKGAAVITAAELLATTGGVAQVCFGVGTASGSEQSKDISFAPDFIIIWNDISTTSHPLQFWMTGMGSNTKKSGGGVEADPPVTVSSTTLTFPTGKESGNHTNATYYYYFAVKFNKQNDPA